MKLCRELAELAEFYEFVGIEGDKDGGCKLNGRYFYVTRLTY